MTQNTLASHKKFFNWSRGLRNMSQKADFESDLTLPHSCHIMKKVGKKGIMLCYISENWHKMAQNGASWLKKAKYDFHHRK